MGSGTKIKSGLRACPCCGNGSSKGLETNFSRAFNFLHKSANAAKSNATKKESIVKQVDLKKNGRGHKKDSLI